MCTVWRSRDSGHLIYLQACRFAGVRVCAACDCFLVRRGVTPARNAAIKHWYVCVYDNMTNDCTVVRIHKDLGCTKSVPQIMLAVGMVPRSAVIVDSVPRPTGVMRIKCLRQIRRAIELTREETHIQPESALPIAKFLEARAAAKHPSWNGYTQAISNVLILLGREPDEVLRAVPGIGTQQHDGGPPGDSHEPAAAATTGNADTSARHDTRGVGEHGDALERVHDRAQKERHAMSELQALYEFTKAASDGLGQIVRCQNRACPSNRKKNPLPQDIEWKPTQTRAADECQTDVWECRHCNFKIRIST